MPRHRKMTGAETQTATREQENAAKMPPRLGCALGAAEVQSSRNPDVVYTQVNEHYFLYGRYARSAGQTREPGDETARADKSTRRPARPPGTPRHMKVLNPAGQPSVPPRDGTADRAVTRAAACAGRDGRDWGVMSGHREWRLPPPGRRLQLDAIDPFHPPVPSSAGCDQAQRVSVPCGQGSPAHARRQQ